jgi:hypothetical protein
LLAGFAFLAGCLTSSHALADARTIVTSFFGGGLAVLTLYVSFSKPLFENLTSLVDAREEKIKVMQEELIEERAERKSAMAELEARHMDIINQMKAEIEKLSADNAQVHSINEGLQKAMVDAQNRAESSESEKRMARADYEGALKKLDEERKEHKKTRQERDDAVTHYRSLGEALELLRGAKNTPKT